METYKLNTSGTRPNINDAKYLVRNYIIKHVEGYDALTISEEDVFVVWWCYILGGWKCLIGTKIHDGRYYEVTYNHAKNELYFDAYKIEEKIAYKVETRDWKRYGDQN